LTPRRLGGYVPMRLSALIARDFRNLEGRIPLCDPLAVIVGGNNAADDLLGSIAASSPDRSPLAHCRGRVGPSYGADRSQGPGQRGQRAGGVQALARATEDTTSDLPAPVDSLRLERAHLGRDGRARWRNRTRRPRGFHWRRAALNSRARVSSAALAEGDSRRQDDLSARYLLSQRR